MIKYEFIHNPLIVLFYFLNLLIFLNSLLILFECCFVIYSQIKYYNFTIKHVLVNQLYES